ncbi:MAG TPA: PAS-domain containing protein, partial [Acidobacteriaceae bacterium]
MTRLLEDFAQVSGDWFWEMDTDLRFTYFSSRWEQVFGYSPRREIGKSRLEMAVNADNKALWQAHLEDLLARRPFRDLTYPYRHQNGSIVWLRISGQPVFGPHGEFKGYRGVGTNVTAEVEAREKLANVLAELKSANAQLELQNLLFDAALNNMSHGLCMWDSDLRIIVCNRRFLEIYGFSADVVKPGISLRDVVRHSFEIGNHDDCSSAEELYASAVSELATRRGLTVERQLNGECTIMVIYRPMSDGRWVAIYEDITERKRYLQQLKQREEELRIQNERFDAAVSNICSGLSMFDADQRLIIMNRRYAEFFRLPEELTRPGVTLRQIREHRVKAGCAPVGEKSAFLGANLTGSKPWSYISELDDGRSISFRSVQTADGGWVGTHDDVTELRRAELSLTVERSRLSAALENMSQGLAMFDAERNLIVCNARYAEVYGLPFDLIKPGMSQADVLRLHVSHGVWTGGDPDAYVRNEILVASDREEGNSIRELPDGRVIAVNRRPTPGGGWVSTHEDITERRRMEAKVAHMARHDALTDLPNRHSFREEMDAALDRLNRTGETTAALCLDLDNFKAVNDTLGHPLGDRLLCQVGKRLKECLRGCDRVARLGGDEFAVLCPGSDPHQASTLARRIGEVLSAPYDVDGHHLVVGTSIGIAIAPADGTDPDQLLKKADLALYRAKAEGRGAFCFFEPEMDAHAQARRTLELDLRQALTCGEFELFYQPIVNASTGEVGSLEALIRWNHPGRGRISPAEFIPLAEDIGLIVPIGEWVLRQACGEAATWPDPIKVAVNLSPAQFRSKKLLQAVVGALSASGLVPSRLELEITESVLLHDRKATLETLHSLRQLGVRISMDDFGTGYSSLGYLRSFPFDKIKIDQSFVRDLDKT